MDGIIDIAIGKNRMDKKWQNKEMLWSELVQKLSKTHRTHETYKEYMALKKDKQDNIKDIGGFVGGHISGGRRKNGSIVYRTVITLDADFADNDFWESWQMIAPWASCLYTTHKHSSESPRFRLLLPIDRQVTAEEYEAIARRVASWVDIEIFDTTTFQPTRLMYWPSTSSDGEYIFEQQEGIWLKADEVLNSYDDWKDTTEWPCHATFEEDAKRNIKEQGDPLTKPGLIGAMCRAYTIQEAIAKWLPEIYVQGMDENRYSYVLGSTANGLVIYEDKFAYSHHATDPISGKLCNAWDLIRLHKFGSLDERVKPDTKAQDLPSFKAMADLVAEDGIVKRQLGEERLAGAREAFNEVIDEKIADADPEAWMEAMEVDRSGNYVSTINNIVLILENDPALKGAFGFNEFTNREVMLKDLPWRKYKPKRNHLVDSDDSSLRHYLEYIYGISGERKIHDGLAVVIRKNSFHPITDYLDSLQWDGIKRLDTLLIDYLGAEDTKYTREVTRKTFIAAVARVFDPGCKFDFCLVLAGDEGKGKSTIVNKMGMEWYSDSFMGVQGERAMEQLHGVWIMEIAELAGFKKAEVESVKHFISKQVDEFRIAYGKRKDTFPRQGIFIATTNEMNFLKDYNGNRKFWPVVINKDIAAKSVFNEFGRDVVDQVWAEACLGWLEGEKLYLDKTTEALAKEVQSEHMELDARIGIVQNFLDTLVPEDWKEKTTYERRAWLQAEKDAVAVAGTMIRKQVSVAEIYCELFGGAMREFNNYMARDLNNIMSRIKGWTRTKKMVNQKLYGRQYVYERQIDTE